MSYSKTRKINISSADREFSKMMRQKGNYTCEVCGYYSEHYVAAHHVIGRVNKRLRYEPLNCCLLCPSHHVFDSEFSAHKTPKDFREWFEEKYPDKWEYINRVRNERMSERDAVEQFKQLNENK